MSSRPSLPGPDNITRVVLKNGITVLVYSNKAVQSVFMIGSLHAGSLYETPDQNGLASMTASALMRGTHERDFSAIHSALEDIGADLDLNAGTHKVGFNGKALAEDLPVLVDLLSDVLRYPAFPATQVDRLRGEVMTWLQYRQQDTRWQAGRIFRENLYPDVHPYHYSTSGTLETLPALACDKLYEFHQQQYGPQGMNIVIVGNVEPQAAIDIVRHELEDWQNPDQPPVPPLPELSKIEEIKRAAVNVPGKTQSDIVLGVAGPSRFAPDYQAANLGNSVLGQFGMMGRLGKTIREDLGLAYYASSRLDGGYGPGAWSIFAGVNPKNVDLTIERASDEIHRIASETISDDDLRDNQSYFTGRLPLQLESNEGIASAILNMENYDLGLDYLVNYRDTINRITKDDVLAAVKHYWTPEAFVVAVAGPNGNNPS
jgi:zinc protease